MFARLLERLATELEAAGLPYMIIGGQAVLLYGEPRLTRDIDVTLGVDVDRLDDVLELIGRVGVEPLVDAKEFTPRTMVLPCIERSSGIRVDLLFSFSPYEREAIGRVREVAVGGARVRFASPEDLVVHKIVAGRPRDLEDVVGVIAKNPAVDLGYVRRWLAQFEQAMERPMLSTLDTLVGDRS